MKLMVVQKNEFEMKTNKSVSTENKYLQNSQKFIIGS